MDDKGTALLIKIPSGIEPVNRSKKGGHKGHRTNLFTIVKMDTMYVIIAIRNPPAIMMHLLLQMINRTRNRTRQDKIHIYNKN